MLLTLIHDIHVDMNLPIQSNPPVMAACCCQMLFSCLDELSAARLHIALVTTCEILLPTLGCRFCNDSIDSLMWTHVLDWNHCTLIHKAFCSISANWCQDESFMESISENLWNSERLKTMFDTKRLKSKFEEKRQRCMFPRTWVHFTEDIERHES